MFIFSKKSDEVQEGSVDMTEFFNPDPLVNRMNVVIRMLREYEFTKDEVVKHYLEAAVKMTLTSLKVTEGYDHDEVYH
jgi:hypothetical protein